jgi:hypothetical protein
MITQVNFIERRIDWRQMLTPLDRELVLMVRAKRGAKARRTSKPLCKRPASVPPPPTEASETAGGRNVAG